MSGRVRKRSGHRRRRPLAMALLLALACAGATAHAQETATASPESPSPDMGAGTRSGQDIYRAFREGLADPECDADASAGRWKKQFAHAPAQLARTSDDVLPLFGYVVDALREAQLPTEFALIPFVESGYRPGARNSSGPSGLWQFVAITARNHGVPMRAGYDGRLSPVDSTRAAIRYLKTLHGMFGGDWRLTVMAYNAGEYRLLQSLRRAGMNASNADPSRLPGLAPVTHAYVQKLHALACIFEQADDRGEWLDRLDRPVPLLAEHELPRQTPSLDHWARDQGYDAAWLKRINPSLASTLPRLSGPTRVLAPSTPAATAPASAEPLTMEAMADALTGTGATPEANGSAARAEAGQRSHTVRSGESAWTIARRYGLRPAQLLARNGLKANAILRPGMRLRVDAGFDR